MKERMYLEVAGQSRSFPVSYFLIKALLKSRIELGGNFADENDSQGAAIYLGLTLARMAEGNWPWQLVTPYSSEIWQRQQAAQTRTDKVAILRVNGEARLLAPVFDATHLGISQSGFSKQIFGSAEMAALGRTCYLQAHEQAERLVYGANVSALYRSIGEHFFDYLALIKHLAGEYLNMNQTLSNGELCLLQQGISISYAQDQFLDSYSSWRKDPSTANRQLLQRATEALQELDPKFSFELPS